MRIKYWGFRTANVKIGGNTFTWTFLLAAAQF
jgi:hypothetical protein